MHWINRHNPADELPISCVVGAWQLRGKPRILIELQRATGDHITMLIILRFWMAPLRCPIPVGVVEIFPHQPVGIDEGIFLKNERTIGSSGSLWEAGATRERE